MRGYKSFSEVLEQKYVWKCTCAVTGALISAAPALRFLTSNQCSAATIAVTITMASAVQ